MQKTAPTRYSYKVKGKKYSSLQEIGNAEGLSKERIRQRMNDPSYDEYQRFLPDGSRVPKPKPVSRRKRGKLWNKSCTINGVKYESQKSAAESLGLDAGGLRYRLMSSNFPEYVSAHHKKMNVSKRYVRIGCSVAGVEYNSVRSAQMALGISHYEIEYRFGSFDYPDYVSPRISKKPSTTRRYKKRQRA